MTEVKIMNYISLLPSLIHDPEKKRRYFDYRNVLTQYYQDYSQTVCGAQLKPWKFFHDAFVAKLDLKGYSFISNDAVETRENRPELKKTGRRIQSHGSKFYNQSGGVF